MAAFSECEQILDARPLRQGDVLRPLKDQGDLWDGISIVVTADCDIARSKHAGRLTCVPILSASSYLALFYMPRRLAKIGQQVGECLTKLMRQAQQVHLTDFPQPISSERCLKWVLQSESQTIAQRLRLTSQETSTFLQLADSFRGTYMVSEDPFPRQCEAYHQAAEALGRQAATVKTALAADLANHLRDLPGDAMFLTSLGNGYHSGYVVYLRVLRELKDEQVALKSSSRSFEITHERIGHLKPPYLYRLTQQLGAVFSSIGLPTEYEMSRDALAQRILQGQGD